MARSLKLRSPILRRVLMLITIPLVLTSTGYALFSQSLSVNGGAQLPNYTSSQNLSLSYTKSVAAQGQVWTYTVSVTVKNDSGSRTVSAWQTTFDLPSDYSNNSCTNATCSVAGTTITAVNTGTNGTIGPGGSVTYSFTFRSASQTYLFGNITVSGTLVPVYQTVSGLSMTAVAGTRTKSGNKYTWPYTITVTNNSGQNLVGWRITANWSSTETVASMPTTVNYTTTTTQIIITSKSALNTGNNFVFNPSFTSTNASWALTGYIVEGAL